MLNTGFRRFQPYLLALSLSGCSLFSHHHDLTASGYLTSQGTMRLWRQSLPQQKLVIRTVFTPFQQNYNIQTDYFWQKNHLIKIIQQSNSASSGEVTLRFSPQAELSFMERRRGKLREPLTSETTARYYYDGVKVKQLSDSLYSGRVKLYQGVWQAGQGVKGCDGKTIPLPFSRQERKGLLPDGLNSQQAIALAWLVGPQGHQLLMVSKQDLCQQQLTASQE